MSERKKKNWIYEKRIEELTTYGLEHRRQLEKEKYKFKKGEIKEKIERLNESLKKGKNDKNGKENWKWF